MPPQISFLFPRKEICFAHGNEVGPHDVRAAHRPWAGASPHRAAGPRSGEIRMLRGERGPTVS